jgi:hypothetical protein
MPKGTLIVSVREGYAQWAWGDGEPVADYTLAGGTRHTISDPSAGYLAAIAAALDSGALVLHEGDESLLGAMTKHVSSQEADEKFHAAVEKAGRAAWLAAEEAIRKEERPNVEEYVRAEMGADAADDAVAAEVDRRLRTLLDSRDAEVREAAYDAASAKAEELRG